MLTKRRVAFLTTLLIALFAIPAGAGSFPCKGEITGDRVYLRAGNSRKYEVLAKFNAGTKVIVLGKYGDYYQLKCPAGVPVWVFGKYLIVKGNTGTVKGTRVNIRARSGNGTVVCQLNAPATLKVLEKKGDWYRVEAPPQAKVFISVKYVKLIPKVTTPTKPEETRPITTTTPKPTPKPVDTWKMKFEQAEKIFIEQNERPIMEADFKTVQVLFRKILAEPKAKAYHTEAKRKIALCEFYSNQQKALKELKDKNEELEKRLQELKEELERKLKEIAEEKEKNKTEEEKFLATGRITSIGMIINRPATHRLVKGEKVIYLLKSDKLNLDDYWGMHVGINGTISPAPKGWEADIITVAEIKVIHGKENRANPRRKKRK